MQDTTVPDDGHATSSRANPPRLPWPRRGVVYRVPADELVAQVLINSWSLATGRTLPPGVPPQWLTEDELISFWADDLIAIP